NRELLPAVGGMVAAHRLYAGRDQDRRGHLFLGGRGAEGADAALATTPLVHPLSVHLIDGTYELFRQFHGRKRFEKPEKRPLGAVAGVLHSVLEMIEKGATHIGVATDHIIESFRNALWPDY